MPLDLKKAAPQEIMMYVPYYKEQKKKEALPYAIDLFHQEELEGERIIESSAPVPFMAIWKRSSLPKDPTLCRVSFNASDNNNDLVYEVTLESSEFIGYLIEVVILFQDKRVIDFPKSFYFKLFRMQLTNS
jgi:hypothetical protein